MISHKTAVDLGGVAANGGSLEVDGSKFSVVELAGIALNLQHDAHLKIHHSDRFSALELGGIAASKPGRVVFA